MENIDIIVVQITGTMLNVLVHNYCHETLYSDCFKYTTFEVRTWNSSCLLLSTNVMIADLIERIWRKERRKERSRKEGTLRREEERERHILTSSSKF